MTFAPAPASRRTHTHSRWALALLATALASAAFLVQAAPAAAEPASRAERMGHGPQRVMMAHGAHGAHGSAHADGLPGMAALMHPRTLDSLGVSAEQRSQLQNILRSNHAERVAQRDARQPLQRQLTALLAAPQLDAAAAEAVRQQLQAQHDAASKRNLQALLDASAVLTPEQRQKLSERLAQRHDMMARPARSEHGQQRSRSDGPRS